MIYQMDHMENLHDLINSFNIFDDNTWFNSHGVYTAVVQPPDKIFISILNS